MRDKETGTWWQQITGKAISGPLQGAALDLVLSDELTFGQWRTEAPAGQVLAPVAKYTKEYDSNWEPDVAKLPVVISFPGTEVKSRDVVIGLTINQSARAYPWETFAKQSPVMDRVGGTPLLLVLGPDDKSFRAFISRIDGKDADFFLRTDSPADAVTGAGKELKKEWILLDSSTGSQWNFQGCAISGAAAGKCLEPVPALKDYWFDWRNYHRDTTVYKH